MTTVKANGSSIPSLYTERLKLIATSNIAWNMEFSVIFFELKFFSSVPESKTVVFIEQWRVKLKLFQPFHNFVHDVICQVHINVFQVRNFLLVFISLLCSFITNPSSSWLFCLKNIYNETIILTIKLLHTKS